LKFGCILSMSYLTLEVEIDHGKVVSKEPGKLPEKATGLLTILQPETPASAKAPPWAGKLADRDSGREKCGAN
jgi:hypothetical protein